MAFEKKVPEWGAAGIEPPESLKERGFTPGYKPPAEYMNWFMHGTGEAIKELQGITPEKIGAVSVEGGTLTGDLSVKKDIPVQRLDVDGSQKMSYWQKNATAIVDYGTVIADGSTADDRTELHIAHDENAFKLRRIESGNVIGDYPIYHEGNKPTAADIGAATPDDVAAVDRVYVAVYGETSLDDISAAVKAEKFVYCDFAGMYAPLMGGIGGLFFSFSCGNDKDGYTFSIDTDGWSYTTYGGYTPKAHADSHKTGGKDALTPADIGAAPAGFGGFGEYLPSLNVGDTEESMEAAFTTPLTTKMANNTMRRYTCSPVKFGEINVSGTAWATTIHKRSPADATVVMESDFGGRLCRVTKVFSNGAWQPVEWENPPMVLGVEYRTTERFADLPVYRKYISGGWLGKGAQTIEHGIGINHPLEVQVFNHESENLTNDASTVSLYFSRSTVVYNSTADHGNVTFSLKYTK